MPHPFTRRNPPFFLILAAASLAIGCESTPADVERVGPNDRGKGGAGGSGASAGSGAAGDGGDGGGGGDMGSPDAGPPQHLDPAPCMASVSLVDTSRPTAT